jgi:glycerophosphoryl diester phosphodiesterase family protein
VIPSRPLALVEIITETFSIYGRTFVRYGLLFLILLVPGICLVTAGGTNLTEDFVTSAKHEINFDDSDLTTARNDINGYISEWNPAFAAMLPGSDQLHPHASTRQLYYFVRTNLTRFASSVDLLAAGLVLTVIGIFALAAVAVDLACQVFEARKQELFGSLRAAFARHVWKMLLLYILYLIAIWVLDAILSFLPGSAGDAISGFVMIAQIYVVLRLMVTIPALVSEESGPFHAIARSWELTRRAGWRIVGASFVFAVLLFVGSIILSTMMQLLFGDVSAWWNDFFTRGHLTLNWFLGTLPGFLRAMAGEMSFMLLIFYSLLSIFGTVLYYDLRTRHDGPLVYVDEQ